MDYRKELLECARYGEPENVTVILESGTVAVDYADDSGNTAMHMAAANGELDCVKVLHRFNAQLLPNESGNLPTHWAAQNGKHEVLSFLFASYSDIDVLQLNKQGRSVLTEAFQSQNTAHDSASEDRLIPDPSKVKVNIEEDEGEAADSEESGATTHTFRLAPALPQVLSMRELPITNPDDPFGKPLAPQDDSTGMAIWPASIILARWVLQICASTPLVFRGRSVAELGAGCALPAITAAVYCQTSTVLITDIHPPALTNARHNLLANGFTRVSAMVSSNGESYTGPSNVHLCSLDWADPSTIPAQSMDVLLGSDLIYDAAALTLFVTAVNHLLKQGGYLLYVAPDTGRDGMADLVSALASRNIVCDTLQPCPDEFYADPLVAETDDLFVLHFYDLAAKKSHTLYSFIKV